MYRTILMNSIIMTIQFTQTQSPSPSLFVQFSPLPSPLSNYLENVEFCAWLMLEKVYCSVGKEKKKREIGGKFSYCSIALLIYNPSLNNVSASIL